jgi:hypothetical protein
MICNYSKRLDSGFHRSDGESGCWTFYEFIKFGLHAFVLSRLTRCHASAWECIPAFSQIFNFKFQAVNGYV